MNSWQDLRKTITYSSSLEQCLNGHFTTGFTKAFAAKVSLTKTVISEVDVVDKLQNTNLFFLCNDNIFQIKARRVLYIRYSNILTSG